MSHITFLANNARPLVAAGALVTGAGFLRSSLVLKVIGVVALLLGTLGLWAMRRRPSPDGAGGGAGVAVPLLALGKVGAPQGPAALAGTDQANSHAEALAGQIFRMLSHPGIPFPNRTLVCYQLEATDGSKPFTGAIYRTLVDRPTQSELRQLLLGLIGRFNREHGIKSQQVSIAILQQVPFAHASAPVYDMRCLRLGESVINVREHSSLDAKGVRLVFQDDSFFKHAVHQLGGIGAGGILAVVPLSRSADAGAVVRS